MANYHISTTGTKSSGTSTADDWTDANCYNQTNVHSITAASGDTFIFSAGTYTLSGTITHLFSTDIKTRGNGDVILQRTTGASVVEINPNNTTKAYLRGIGTDRMIVVGDSVTSSPVLLTNRANDKDIEINQVTIRRSAGVYGLGILHRRGTLSLNDVLFEGVFAQNVIESTTSLADTANMTINLTDVGFDCSSAINGAAYGVKLQKANAAFTLTVNIDNLYGSYNANGGSSAVAYGCLITGGTITIENSEGWTVAQQSTATGGAAMMVRGLDAANQAALNPIVRRNKITYLSQVGDVLGIGQDTTVGFQNGHIVYGNTLTGINNEAGSPHGLAIRGSASGRAYGNKIYRCHSPLIHSLCTSDNVISSGNIIYDCYGVGLSFKGNSGGQMNNNTVHLHVTDYSTPTPKGIWARDQSGTANSASKAYNNNIYVDGLSHQYQFVLVETGDACTFSNNNYYTNTTLPTGGWSYTGTDYDTLVAWQAVEATASNSAPGMVDPANNDYKLDAGSALWRAGKYYVGGKDFRGRRFMIPPAIGAYEPSSGDVTQSTRGIRS